MGTGNPAAGEVQQLTRLQKAAMLSGENVWQTRAIPGRRVPSLFMSDGPHGLRKQVGAADHLGLNKSRESTCFPTAATIANSWDPKLAERVGKALGEEASDVGVDVLLGPGLNTKRSPLGGRNFEYFSEDPYLAGKLAAAYVRGIQSQGIAACPKHFAANSQETFRMVSDSVVDEATLRELYLTAFEIVVRESNPLSVMSSYNLVNGTYAHENAHLLQTILRDEWGFTGAVVTDWGGSNNEVAAISAGGTIEMPSPGYDSVNTILADPSIPAHKLDQRVAEAVALAESVSPKPQPSSIYEDHKALALEAAEKSVVLLKNEDSILPLAAGTRVAVIGDFALVPRYQGAGSSLVNPTELIEPLEALRDSGLDTVAVEQGFKRGADAADPELKRKAVEAARGADVAVLYLGLDELAESEGKDREHLDVAAAQVEVLNAVADVNPTVVVIFAAGAPVTMPWLGRVKGFIHGYLGGQEGAQANVNVLTGKVNPSGRLAETYPLDLEDTPTAGNFPATGHYALYSEGPYIGYRYYATADVPVLFPFGYGQSYTEFTHSGLEADAAGARVTVTNRGAIAGEEVVQVYIRLDQEVRDRLVQPALRLAGFEKIRLEPGETRQVTIPFDDYSFRVYDPGQDSWVQAGGTHGVLAGPNAGDLPLSASVEIAGSADLMPSLAASLPVYRDAAVHEVTSRDFAVLLGRDIPAEPVERRELHMNSPLADLRYSRSALGRIIYTQYFVRFMEKAEKNGKPDLNLLFQYGMPFRAIYKMSGGVADKALVQGILTIVNGHFFQGLGSVIKAFFKNRKRQKQLKERFERESA